MPELLTVPNYEDINIQAETAVLTDTEPNQNILPIENSDGISINKYIVVGEGENAEIAKILTITKQQITTVANLTMKHIRGERVRQLIGNKISIYRAPNVNGLEPSIGTYTLLQTVNIIPDQMMTSYLDATGGSGYWYVFSYVDVDNNDSTDIAEAIAIRGGNANLYVSVPDVREEAGFQNNRYISDLLIISRIERAQSEVNSSLIIGGYTLPLSSPYSEMIVNATSLLAAGYLMTKDYGPEHTGTNKDGQLKIKMARDILAKIEMGGVAIIDGATQSPIALAPGVRGYPDDTAASNYPSEAASFKITDTF